MAWTERSHRCRSRHHEPWEPADAYPSVPATAEGTLRCDFIVAVASLDPVMGGFDRQSDARR